ncbi:hypothetical protein NBRC111894_285 [Sporolactobacillus inulinus]|uniref:Uncharacterized protein n=1 Tax=Sporolactobacillus inulinus TaxID=2078 RepID=A0A4Y1Z761_9BACL|nr:hypothetical protein NBRC111894_285 [Sporolactobacillus inulinus]
MGKVKRLFFQGFYFFPGFIPFFIHFQAAMFKIQRLIP